MWREEENICCQEVDAVKNKNLEAVIVEELQAEPRCIVQHPGFDTLSPHTFISWKLVKADSVCICFVTKHNYTALPWFSFSSL